MHAALYKRIGRQIQSMLPLMAVCLIMPFLVGCASETPPLRPDVKGFVLEQVKSLMATDFRDLRQLNIEYGPVAENTDTIFFETYVKVSTLMRSPRNRTYQIFVNERLANDRPDDEAIRAILVHELLHIRDYVGKNIWQLIRLRLDYEDPQFRMQYERYTDQRTLEMGYGQGLINYRRWLYGMLADPEKVRVKQRIYMTPEEIAAWMARQKKKIQTEKGRDELRQGRLAVKS